MMNTDVLIKDLGALTDEFSVLLNEESNAIHAAQFAQAIALQDRKIRLHTRLTPLLESLKAAPKSDAQKDEVRALLTRLTETAGTNKNAIEHGFRSIDRILGRIFGAMRQTVQKDTPRYNAGGAYHHNRRQSMTLQTDRTA